MRHSRYKLFLRELASKCVGKQSMKDIKACNVTGSQNQNGGKLLSPFARLSNHLVSSHSPQFL